VTFHKAGEMLLFFVPGVLSSEKTSLTPAELISVETSLDSAGFSLPVDQQDASGSINSTSKKQNSFFK